MTDDLTIVVSRRAQLSALRPLARDLRTRQPDLGLHCRCPAELVAEVSRAAGPRAAVEPFPEGPLLDLRRRLHTFLFLLLADPTFSPYFARRVRSAVGGGRPKSLALRLGRRLTPKLSGPSLNRFLRRVVSVFAWRGSFPSRRVVVLTKCGVPHLLCTRRHELVSLLDGWDHPTTSPAGYWTDAVAPWNRDLGDDWMRMQGATRTIAGFAYRFSYLLPEAERSVAAGAAGRPRVLYAMATFPSKSVLDQRRHQEEMEVVRQLHRWLLPHVSSFEVKPHPIGPVGHLDELRASCPAIGIHAYEGSGGATYDLTEDYNRERLSTLRSADLVVGIWTTFLLDAAIAGKGIALVELPEETPLAALHSARLGLHVHYLRERVSAVVDLQPGGPRFGRGVRRMETWLELAFESGQRIARWIRPSAAPDALVQALLAD